MKRRSNSASKDGKAREKTRKAAPPTPPDSPKPPTDAPPFANEASVLASTISLDVLSEVFALFPCHTRLAVLSFVCKRWRQAALRSIFDMTYVLPRNFTRVCALLPHATSLVALTIPNNFEPPARIRKLELCHPSIELPFFRKEAHTNCLPSCAARCFVNTSSLTELTLVRHPCTPSTSTARLLQGCRDSLCTLRIREPLRTMAEVVQDLYFPALTSLYLDVLSSELGKYAAFIARHSSQLTWLTMPRRQHWETAYIGGTNIGRPEWPTTNFPALRFLQVSTAVLEPLQVVEVVYVHLEFLTSLLQANLRPTLHVSLLARVQHVKKLAPLMEPLLTKLELTEQDVPSSRVVAALRLLSHLTSLSISLPEHINRVCTALPTLPFAPVLRKLSLDQQITMRSRHPVCAWLTALTALTSLSLVGFTCEERFNVQLPSITRLALTPTSSGFPLYEYLASFIDSCPRLTTYSILFHASAFHTPRIVALIKHAQARGVKKIIWPNFPIDPLQFDWIEVSKEPANWHRMLGSDELERDQEEID